MSQQRCHSHDNRLLRPVFVKIKLLDVKFQVCKYLQQQTQNNDLYKQIQKVAPIKIISAQQIFGYEELSTYLHKHFSVPHNTLGNKNFDNFVTLLMNIYHDKVPNVLIQKEYVPRKNTKWLWQNIYQDI